MRKKLALTLLLALVGTLFTSNAQAADRGDGTFSFRGTIDADGDGTTDAELGIVYDRELLGDTHSLDAEAGWVDGDRRGYRCGFAFLTYRGYVVARVTLSRFSDPNDPKNAGYVKINDKAMHEQSRNFDGTVNTTGEQTKDCTAAVEEYEPLDGPVENPVVTFQHGPHAIDVRDFLDPADVTGSAGVVFDLVSATDTQAVIIAYAEGGTLPILTVYYDLIGDVEKGVAVGDLIPGTQHHVSLHTGCGLECSHSHDPDPTEDPTEDPTPTEDPAPDPPLVGDLDGDGRVNILDLRILIDNWTD